MLSKFSVLMTFLMAIASLVGISSIIYKPANFERQAQLSSEQLAQPI